MRLIEQHGDGAEIAAVLRARIRSIQDEELTREAVLSAVLSAIAELRDSGNRSLH
jgi:predicted AAA+ superfamily ATPase